MGAMSSLLKKPNVSKAISESNPAKAQDAAATAASREASEDIAARRRARRSARALLSENRLNPEQGVTTLGQTGL